jgi:transcriptional regulator GlxA family with amidase domain
VDTHPRPEHTVWLLAFDRVQPLDVTGPHEVLHGANVALDHFGRPGPRYRLHVVGTDPGATTVMTVVTESGLRLAVDPRPAPTPPPDTLLLPGGDGVRDAARDPELVAWVAAVGAAVPRLACVCSGPFLAAAAGLLADRHVATHWARAGQLARAHPEVHVEPDAIWRRDGNVWSSAGVTAGIDLALAIVEADHGPEVAQHVARWLVVFLRRPGGQSQFAAPAWQPTGRTPPVRQAQELVDADPGQDLTLPVLARHVGLSPRHLARRFTAEVGVTPAKYVERVRVVAARNHLEESTIGLEAVARRCGFGTAETMRRTFLRHVGVPPDQYRRRFATPPAQEP